MTDKMGKDSLLDNIRAPIVKTIYHSPFEGLNKHSDKVDECVVALKKCVYAYVKGDFEKADKYAELVSQIEHEADQIKANTRNHLPKFVFLSVSKSDFLHLLKESDSILDYAEDVAVLIAMKHTEVPPELGKGITDVMDKVYKTVKSHQHIMTHMNTLVEVSFGGKERDKVKRHIKSLVGLVLLREVVEGQLKKKKKESLSQILI